MSAAAAAGALFKETSREFDKLIDAEKLMQKIKNAVDIDPYIRTLSVLDDEL